MENRKLINVKINHFQAEKLMNLFIASSFENFQYFNYDLILNQILKNALVENPDRYTISVSENPDVKKYSNKSIWVRTQAGDTDEIKFGAKIL